MIAPMSARNGARSRRRLDYRPPAFLVAGARADARPRPRGDARHGDVRVPSQSAAPRPNSRTPARPRRRAAARRRRRARWRAAAARRGCELRRRRADDPGAAAAGHADGRASTIAPAANVGARGALRLVRACSARNASPKGSAGSPISPTAPTCWRRYTVTMRADRERYPVLLSNGNLVAAGRARPAAGTSRRWHDPFPKPSYLFALVAGDLAALDDTFTTRSGRRVALAIYSTPAQPAALPHAMDVAEARDALGRGALRPRVRPRRFMIFCADDFNMGAMENKGLNIFNSRLRAGGSARPRPTTTTRRSRA